MRVGFGAGVGPGAAAEREAADEEVPRRSSREEVGPGRAEAAPVGASSPRLLARRAVASSAASPAVGRRSPEEEAPCVRDLACRVWPAAAAESPVAAAKSAAGYGLARTRLFSRFPAAVETVLLVPT